MGKHAEKIIIGYLVAGILVHLWSGHRSQAGKPIWGGFLTKNSTSAALRMAEGIVLWPVSAWVDLTAK